MKNHGGKAISLFAVYILAICGMAVLNLMGNAMGEVSRTGLVGEWHFEGDAKDSSGNGNDGTVYGARFVDGKFGKALSFHRADDGIEVPDSNSLDIFSTVTITFYMNVNTNPISGYKWIPLVVKSNSGKVATWNYGVYYGYENDQSILIGFGDGTNFKVFRTPVNSISLNNWYNIVATISPQSSYVYINGVNQPLTDYGGGTATSMAPNNIPLVIGEMKTTASQSDYLIDEVRIYNRALSADEVKANYEAGQIIITSSPSGAEVLIDGQSRGTASPTLTVYGISPGTYAVKCKNTGYSDYETNLVLTAGSSASLNCILNQATTSTTSTSPTAAPATPQNAASTAAPVLSLSPDPFSINLGTMNSGGVSSQSISITNEGSGTLTWSISDDQPWITLNPVSGTNSGTVIININTAGLSPGAYTGTITVNSNSGTRKGNIYLNIPAVSSTATITTPAQTSTPLTAGSTNLVSIIAVILVIMGLLLTTLTTMKKDISIDIGISEKSLKYVGGAGILLIILGAYLLLKSSGLI